jgi:hypothetical protein
VDAESDLFTIAALARLLRLASIKRTEVLINTGVNPLLAAGYRSCTSHLATKGVDGTWP